MAKYLFVESRDPFESRDTEAYLELVRGTAGGGNEVVLYLIQNGVLSARKGSRFNESIQQLSGSNVSIHADDFSLRERAIDAANTLEQVTVSGMDQFVALLLEPGTKAVWH